MSYNGSGTFQINTSGQPVVAGTVISSTAFNALTADLATGLSTAITKDGQTTTTARIPFAAGINSSLTTDSSSVSTGSIITAGGVGVAKALYVGTTANVASTTDSSSISTGAIVTAGGAGIAKNLYVGANANVAGTLGVTGVATFSAAPIYSSLTASSAVATDASKALVSVTNTGTGDNVLATSPTLVTPILGTPQSGTLTNCTGLPTTALTGAITEANGGTGTTIGYNGFKNRLINSAMVIDQRNAGASVTPASSAYTLDRWQAVINVASKFSVQQSSTTATGFSKSLLATSTSAYSIGASEYCLLQQGIEGFNIADLGWGTANAQTITLSFQVRSSLTGTFGGVLANSNFSRCYPFTYTISSANTFESKTVTIAGDTSGTWDSTNGAGILVNFSLGSGSTVSGTAGAWAGTLYTSATGATSVVGTNGATFYITGVQLEKGSTATSFDYRPYGTELQLAQRYYAKTFGQSTAPAQAVGSIAGALAGFGQNASVGPAARFQFPVVMRAAPSTVTTYSPFQSDANWRESSNATSNTAVVGTALDSGVVITSSTQTGTNYFYIHVTANAEL